MIAADTENARFEFRVFGLELGGAIDAITHLPDMRKRTTIHTNESYLISQTADQTSCKIRNHRLDLKILLRHHGVLQQWKPVTEAGFPISSDFLSQTLFPLMRNVPPSNMLDTYSYSDFKALIASISDIDWIDVEKERHLYETSDNLLCEAALVSVHGVNSATLCCESTDPDRLMQSIEALGIGSAENTSYPQYLQTLLHHR